MCLIGYTGISRGMASTSGSKCSSRSLGSSSRATPSTSRSGQNLVCTTDNTSFRPDRSLILEPRTQGRIPSISLQRVFSKAFYILMNSGGLERIWSFVRSSSMIAGAAATKATMCLCNSMGNRRIASSTVIPGTFEVFP